MVLHKTICLALGVIAALHFVSGNDIRKHNLHPLEVATAAFLAVTIFSWIPLKAYRGKLSRTIILEGLSVFFIHNNDGAVAGGLLLQCVAAALAIDD